jgi:hypothetical protein
VCSINMRGGARGGSMPDMPPCKTLAATPSWLNSEALAACMVLAHPRAAFHLRTRGLHRGTTAVAAALIGFDDVKVAVEMKTTRRQS